MTRRTKSPSEFTHRCSIEQPDGSELEYATTVEYSDEDDGEYLYELRDITPTPPTKELERQLFERASVAEAESRRDAEAEEAYDRWLSRYYGGEYMSQEERLYRAYRMKEGL